RAVEQQRELRLRPSLPQRAGPALRRYRGGAGWAVPSEHLHDERPELPGGRVDVTGAFVVAWSSGGSAGSDTDSFSVQGQRFGVMASTSTSTTSSTTSSTATTVPI